MKKLTIYGDYLGQTIERVVYSQQQAWIVCNKLSADGVKNIRYDFDVEDSLPKGNIVM